MTLPLASVGVPTISPEEAHPGDAVFCSGGGFVDRAIQLGQKLRRLGSYGKWNHVAWLDSPVLDADGKVVDWVLGQALSNGVQIGQLLSVRGSGVEIVPLDAFPTIIPGAKLDRATHLATLRAEVGVKYGWLTIASIVVTILTPKWVRFDFRRDNTFICSGLFSWGLHSAGGLVTNDIYQRLPGEVAQTAG